MVIHKIRHRDKDCVGTFIPWHLELIRKVEILLDLPYSTSRKGWNISSTITHYETLFDLFSLDKPDYRFLLPEQSTTGTITYATVEDDHTGVSSPVEKLIVPTSITIKQEAADIQDDGRNRRQISFTGRQFRVLLFNEYCDGFSIKSRSGSYWNVTYGNWRVRESLENLTGKTETDPEVTPHTLHYFFVTHLMRHAADQIMEVQNRPF